MWRSYDMVDGVQQQAELRQENTNEEMLRQDWRKHLELRLLPVVEAKRSESIVRIPPGYLSF